MNNPIDKLSLQNQLNKPKKMSNDNWISVKDKLPPASYTGRRFSDAVLVFNDDEITMTFYDLKEGKWHLYWGNEIYLESVTHWQPLPEPPKSIT